MDYRRLGKSGLKVSEFSFGSWVTFAKQVDLRPQGALDPPPMTPGSTSSTMPKGMRPGSPSWSWARRSKELGWSRDSYIVSSKVFLGRREPTQRGLSAKHVTEACHAALKRLRVDHLDLYFLPPSRHRHAIEETVRAMHNLIVQGKVLYWAPRNGPGQQITEAHLVARRDG